MLILEIVILCVLFWEICYLNTGSDDKNIKSYASYPDEMQEMIKKNLRLDTDDVVEWCKEKVLDEGCNIYKRGKNRYCEIDNIEITINSYSYTIITAHMIK